MTVMVNTLCRPDAAFDLAPGQVNWEYGTVNLNPEGREQTKKYRPIVPVTKALKPFLKKCSAPKIINYRGKGVAEIDTAWKKMVTNSGINPVRVNPYSIRHTMGRVLRAAKIKGEEISIYLGHKPVDENDVTTIYSPYDPTYLRDAAKAVDGYWARLQAEIGRQAKTFKPRKNRPGQRNDLKEAA
jgi:integrase